MYLRNRAALLALDPGDEEVKRFKELTIHDLRCNTYILGGADQQHIRKEKLGKVGTSWFWGVPSEGGTAWNKTPEWLDECKWDYLIWWIAG